MVIIKAYIRIYYLTTETRLNPMKETKLTTLYKEINLGIKFNIPKSIIKEFDIGSEKLPSAYYNIEQEKTPLTLILMRCYQNI